MPTSDQIFLIGETDVKPLEARPYRAGLFGKNLEDALQALIAKQPNVINGRVARRYRTRRALTAWDELAHQKQTMR